jgi:uncharacterized membrane protein YphA (DoxX/SURF4 family)
MERGMPITRWDARAVGRCFLGLAASGSGALQLVIGQPVRLFSTGGGESPSAWPYIVGVVLLAAGCAIAAGRRVRTGAAVLAGLILMSLVVASLPRLLANPWVAHLWTNPLKSAALAAGAALLVAAPTTAPIRSASSPRAVRRVERVAAAALAVFLLACGAQHFVYADFVGTLVPSWIPGHRFWTYMTGVALIAGGAGILVPRARRLAATLSSLMIFLWVLLLHIPRAVAGPAHAFETAGVFEALAISGIALMIAATARRVDRSSQPGPSPPAFTAGRR